VPTLPVVLIRGQLLYNYDITLSNIHTILSSLQLAGYDVGSQDCSTTADSSQRTGKLIWDH
jgi:hypothetical protein